MARKAPAPNPAPEKPPQAGWLKRTFVRGLAALLPTIATIAILFLLLNFFYSYAAKPMSLVLEWLANQTDSGARFLLDYPNAGDVLLAILGFLIALALFAALGLLVHGLFGKRIFEVFEEGLLQLPVVRAIYPHAKQVVEFFFDKKRPAFHAVVAIPYPHPDVYSIAFVTSDGLRSLNEGAKGKLVSCFIPSSPVPMTGWITFVPVENVVPLSLPVDDALRFMVSAGLIVPEGEEVDLGERSPRRRGVSSGSQGKS